MIDLKVNGQTVSVDAEPDTPLLWVLRDTLGLTGTKYGCGIGACGACAVILDGAIQRSCAVTIDSLDGVEITTIEAIEADEVGAKVVAAWIKNDVPQCGYCQSGQVMAVTALLKATPQPSPADIAAGVTNLCRCGTYNQIAAAIADAAAAA
jgi:isoquinoline 1-oxidoreductase alpha subunit